MPSLAALRCVHAEIRKKGTATSQRDHFGKAGTVPVWGVLKKL